MGTVQVLWIIVTIIVAWLGGALSVWLTRDDARTTRLLREIAYLNSTLEDLADVAEKQTAAIESRFPKLATFVPDVPDAEGVKTVRGTNAYDDIEKEGND